MLIDVLLFLLLQLLLLLFLMMVGEWGRSAVDKACDGRKEFVDGIIFAVTIRINSYK